MSLTLTLERGGDEVSGSGTNIELDGTIAGGAIESVEMYGDTEQQTYSGKNLLNITKGTFTQNGITFTQNPDGSVTMNGTSTGNAYYEMNNTAASQTTITSGVRYTLSIGNVTLPSGQVIVQLRKANPNTVYCAVNDKSASFTAPETTTTFTYIGVYGSGVTLNNVTIYPMLEVGSSMTSFEPYVGGTASPNPDYPQEVQTVTGRQVVTITDGGSESQEYEINLGKNLFDKDNYSILEGYFQNSDTEIKVATSARNRVLWIPCSPSTTYSIKLAPTTYGIITKIATSSVVPADLTKITHSLRETGDTVNGYTTDASARYLCLYLQSPSGTDMANLIDDVVGYIQIEKGSTATTYAPYFTPIELCKIGTYQDYIYKSGDDWYVHKETGKSFMGSLTWNPASTGTSGVYRMYSDGVTGTVLIPSTGSEIAKIVCSHYTPETAANTWSTMLGVAVQTTDGRLFVYDSAYNTNTSQSAFTTWLTNNNVVLYYALATPTDTQITNSALIAQLNALNAGDTYDGTTLITVASENLAGSLDVKVSSNITKTYTEVEIGSPFTIADVEGKSSNTTLDGNVYVDWAYNKKQYSFDLFNLTPQDYADIRAFYDYQFNNSAFPTITVPELNIDKLPVYMEISSRNIINQCLLTDKLTIKFRETVQP